MLHGLRKDSIHIVVWAMLAVSLALNGARAAVRTVASEFLGDFDIASSGSAAFDVDWSGLSQVSGIGFVADWTAVVADNGGGLNPWALDLRATVSAPSGDSLVWDPIGGDITIADYPLADYSSVFSSPQAGGSYSVAFTTPGVPSPYVSGLRGSTLYATEVVPDVTWEYDGSVASGSPTWNRPFFIDGISGLGPVAYDVLPFTVSESGGYSFLSVIPSSNNFTFLYRGDFDPTLPLDNLLDYGLGNGSGQNGTPQGTSLIEALLLEGESYFYVTSQFQQAIPGSTFETTIIGPGNIQTIGPGDFNGDGDYACDDVDALVAAIVAGSQNSLYDLDGDGAVAFDDLTAWLAEAGFAENDSGAPYLAGDADLNGAVDGNDFLVWNQNKFSPTPAWCHGDFNADGEVSGADFLLWNQNKFTFADLNSVPEPATGVVLWIGIGFAWLIRKRQA
jgi:hypothetical protein